MLEIIVQVVLRPFVGHMEHKNIRSWWAGNILAVKLRGTLPLGLSRLVIVVVWAAIISKVLLPWAGTPWVDVRVSRRLGSCSRYAGLLAVHRGSLAWHQLAPGGSSGHSRHAATWHCAGSEIVGSGSGPNRLLGGRLEGLLGLGKPDLK